MDLSDIQGIVFHPYRRLPHARYVLLRFREHQEEAAREWLAALVENECIDTAEPKDAGPVSSPHVRLNIAFTSTGLERLGLHEDALASFPLAFIEGLGAPWSDADSPDHRSRILGDVGASAPAHWDWGYQGDRDRTVDALLLAFSNSPARLDDQVRVWIRDAEDLGAVTRGTAITLHGRFPDNPGLPVREPFGFVDGISQPVLTGALAQLGHGRQKQPAVHELEDGEMLLGHRDGNRQVSASPTVRANLDPDRVLPAADSTRRDLGFNGTYLVFRQLEQNVNAFRQACETASAAAGMAPDHFAAMLVGRWQDGSPLIRCPIGHDDTLKAAPAGNDFSYRDDPHGERCPSGAHIRRANPRDSLGPDPDESWRVANRHRILRRGRPYWNGQSQGLHFICLNADIVRQFEFIQQNWINDATFGGVSGEDDPLVGSRQGHAAGGAVTLPPPPDNRLARRVNGLGRFVTVKGGGYFFLPSLTALRYLARSAPAPARPPLWRPAAAEATRTDRLRLALLGRFPILLALVLLAAPLALRGRGQLTQIVRPMFHLDTPRDMLIVSALASLAASVALLTFRLVELYAAVRFDVHAAPLRRLTWRRVACWQIASLPIVATALWRSAADATAGSEELLGQLGRFGLAAVGGYAVAFAVLFVADAARERSVRPDNAEDSLFLPASRLRLRLKRLRSPIDQFAGGLARFIESHLARSAPTFAVGYVDHVTGRILPGHLAALTLVVTLGVIYLAGWWLLRPPYPLVGFQVPPLAYLLFVLFSAGLAVSGVAFFLDRYRIPLLTALVVWLVAAAAGGGTDHQFQVAAQALDRPASVSEMIASADAFHGNRTDPIVVVTAGGGGVHQAVWTARVLAGLTELWGPAFSGNVRLVSAVSAGSVGAMHFVNEFSPNGPPRGRLPHVTEAATASTTGDIWWGLAYPDLSRALLPSPLKRLVPATQDRGWALEQGWHRALGLGPDSAGPAMGRWQADVLEGWRPAVAFNAMIAETGRRAVLATYRLPDGSAAESVSSITSDRDLSVITAVRLSAAFPFVTPFARPSVSEPKHMFHLADGGYWDNYAVFSALEWLREAMPALSGRKVLVIQIPPTPGQESPSRDRAWVWQPIAPLVALMSVRTNAQAARNEFEIEQMKEKWPSIVWATLSHSLSDVSLGWHLSRREQREIEQAWFGYTANLNHPELVKIAAVLGQPTAPQRVLASE